MIKTLIYGLVVAFFVVQTADIPPMGGADAVAAPVHVAAAH